ALVGAAPASAQRIAGALSERQIEVTSNFVGRTLTLFGNVEPAIGADSPGKGPFHVIIVVTGPLQDRVVRRQTNRFLIWLNTENEIFFDIPSYNGVLSSDSLGDIADETVLANNHILLSSTGGDIKSRGNANPGLFNTQLVRLMIEKKLYGLNQTGVHFLSPTLYSARLELPGDVPNGTFLAETFLFRDREIIAHQAESFIVRKAGLERLLGESARDYPFLYGLTCVLLALTTGWLGGVVFRR
ncbi:MAG: TIGR02186 family protein, partial [Novosphingobium sp.]